LLTVGARHVYGVIKVVYCLKGLIKAKSFSQRQKKTRYLYVLTPAGIENKAALTKRFLKRKIAEYEALHADIGVEPLPWYQAGR
jgi:septum formation inhibitor-activating ATPase MinD